MDLPRSEACCGFGGTFAVKNADTSVAMGLDKVDDVLETGAEVLTAGDTSCLMHIGGLLSRRGSPIRVMHLAEILASTGPRGATRVTHASELAEPSGPHRREGHEPTFAGTPPFPEAARIALADEQLRANLGRATATIRTKRAAAVAERTDWEALRLSGAAIKDEVMRDLPALLAQLEQAVTAAGGIVHWAGDAAEANAIVASIARAAGATEIVKVKSMATQEIELNEALRQEGIDVWETDLAEMIVQLGHDLPSHILVPAIHKNRTEIRDIFINEMGRVGRPAPAGLNDDPHELAEAARLHLREKFLRARVARSGGHFPAAGAVRNRPTGLFADP